MRPLESGIVKIYSADPEWVAGSGSDFNDKRNHPNFYIQSFIDCVFPDARAKTWAWFTPMRTIFVQAKIRPTLFTNNRDSVGRTPPEINSLAPIYAEVLMMLSGAKTLKDTMFNRAALTRLIHKLHLSDWTHVVSAARSKFLEDLSNQLQAWIRTPIREAYYKAFAKRQRTSARIPLAMIRSKMETKKQIREGIAKSRTLAISVMYQHEQFSAIVGNLTHKMKEHVVGMRYQTLDRLIDNTNDPLCPSAEDCISVGQVLQECQLEEADNFCDRLQAVRDEFEESWTDYEEAIRDLFQAVSEG